MILRCVAERYSFGRGSFEHIILTLKKSASLLRGLRQSVQFLADGYFFAFFSAGSSTIRLDTPFGGNSKNTGKKVLFLHNGLLQALPHQRDSIFYEYNVTVEVVSQYGLF